MGVMTKHRITATAAVGLIVTGCAASVERPVDELAAAQAAIDQAEASQAQRFAPDRLVEAREKIQRARAMSNRGDHEVAARLAEQAQVDAEVAAASAEAAESRQAAAEVSESLRTLEREINRQSND